MRQLYPIVYNDYSEFLIFIDIKAQPTKETGEDDRVKYELRVVNNSTNAMSVCVFQTMPPEMMTPNIMSMAWFAKKLYPTTTCRFDWEPTYQFVWDETGELAPGIAFDSAQCWEAGLSENNAITLHFDGEAYTFQDPTTNPQALGSLVIQQDGTIPLKQAAVGIGMGGAPTFVVQAQPNMSLIFTPHPVYWVTFGEYERGQVLDAEQITNKVQIQFPPNIYSMTATLDAANLWTVRPSEF